jgi:hypothetical protein
MEPDARVAVTRDAQGDRYQLLGFLVENAVARCRTGKIGEALHHFWYIAAQCREVPGDFPGHVPVFRCGITHLDVSQSDLQAQRLASQRGGLFNMVPECISGPARARRKLGERTQESAFNAVVNSCTLIAAFPAANAAIRSR